MTKKTICGLLAGLVLSCAAVLLPAAQTGANEKSDQEETIKLNQCAMKTLHYNEIEFSRAEDDANVITVGKGKMCSTIKEAVLLAEEKFPEILTTTTKGLKVMIEISEGTYDDEMNFDYNENDQGLSVNGIYFKGIGNVVITGKHKYPYAALCSFGSNVYENLTFSSSGKISYAFHYEAGNKTLDENSETIFRNCNFISEDNSAVGVGTAQQNTRLIFEKCSFDGTGNDVFLHNCVVDGSGNDYIEFIDCDLGDLTIHDSARFDEDNNSKLTICFTNTTYDTFTFYAGYYGPYADEVFDKPVEHDNITFICS